MKNSKFNSYDDLSNYMMDMANDGFNIVTVTHYKEALLLLRKLLHFEKLKVGIIDIAEPHYNNYDKEYYVSVSEDMFVSVEPAYVNGKYLDSEADIALLHESASSSILKHLDCKNCYELNIPNIDEHTINKSDSENITDEGKIRDVYGADYNLFDNLVHNITFLIFNYVDGENYPETGTLRKFEDRSLDEEMMEDAIFQWLWS